MHFGRHDFRSFQLQLHVVLFWWFWKDEKEKEEKVGDGDPGEVGFESILWTKSFFSRSFSRHPQTSKQNYDEGVHFVKKLRHQIMQLLA